MQCNKCYKENVKIIKTDPRYYKYKCFDCGNEFLDKRQTSKKGWLDALRNLKLFK